MAIKFSYKSVFIKFITIYKYLNEKKKNVYYKPFKKEN